MLGATGFEGLDLQGVVGHSDKIGIENIVPVEWDDGVMAPLVEAGAITEEDVEVMHREHIRFHASEDKYMMYVLLLAKGQKPG
jgi:hypothetical protein